MRALLVLIFCFGLFIDPSFAQQQPKRPQVAPRPQGGVATQPSNNPFNNPIGQGVPPAASSSRTQNNTGQTNVPLTPPVAK